MLIIRVLFLFLILILNTCISKISISNPQELSSMFSGTFTLILGSIKEAYANFGKNPYGQIIMGRLYYNTENTDIDYACKPLTGIVIQQEMSDDRSPIVMV